MMRRQTAVLGIAMSCLASTPSQAHDGPPFPIVSDRAAGAYIVSVWTDPDTTDDGTAGGQFWIMVATRGRSGPVPASTRATVAAVPLDRTGARAFADASPVRGDASTQFAGLVLDHEGRFRVEVAVNGPLGRATIESEVTATYDLRPPPIMMLLYLMPFLLVGLLWTRLLLRRRRAAAGVELRRDVRRSASMGRP